MPFSPISRPIQSCLTLSQSRYTIGNDTRHAPTPLDATRSDLVTLSAILYHQPIGTRHNQTKQRDASRAHIKLGAATA
jgi:hypothetical protein